MIFHLIEVSNKISVCTICNGGLQFSYNNFFIDLKRKALARGNSIRFVSELDRNSINIAKVFIDGGIQLRHAKIRKLPPLSFSVTDKQIATTIDMMENGANFQSLIISDDPSYLNHFKKIFEQIWINGIDARVRIADVEEGGESDDEIAEAKHYINEILEEINNMKNNARERDGS